MCGQCPSKIHYNPVLLQLPEGLIQAKACDQLSLMTDGDNPPAAPVKGGGWASEEGGFARNGDNPLGGREEGGVGGEVWVSG